MNAITQLIGGMSQVWPNVTFILCVFGVLIFRPERVAKAWLFWLGCALFALSLVAPTITMFVPVAIGVAPHARPEVSIPVALKLVNLCSSLFFAGAFLATISSLMPTRSPATPSN